VYFLAGYQKLIHSGLSWVIGPTMKWVLYQGAHSGPAEGLARLIAGIPVVPNVFAAGAHALELGAPLLLFMRRTRPWYVLAAIAMHGSIGLLIGLDYSGWVLTVVAVALPWDRRGIRLRPRPQDRIRHGVITGSMEPTASLAPRGDESRR
jgi:hypothetical protein